MPVIKSCAEVGDPVVHEAIQEFLVDCRIRNLSERTIKHYEYRLLDFLDPWICSRLVEVTRSGVRSRIADFLDRMSPASVNGYIRCTKALLNWALREGYGIVVDPRTLRKVREPKRVKPYLTEPEQIAALLAQPDQKRFTGLRDYVILLVFLDTGIRLAELVGMNVDDIRGSHLLIRGKGSKERIVAVSPLTERALIRYLRARSRLDLSDDAVFPSNRRCRINRRWVIALVKQYADRAGLDHLSLSPHKLRYTFATHFIRNGGSIINLQQILGHATLDMSRHYAQVADQDAFEESRAFSPVARMR